MLLKLEDEDGVAAAIELDAGGSVLDRVVGEVKVYLPARGAEVEPTVIEKFAINALADEELGLNVTTGIGGWVYEDKVKGVLGIPVASDGKLALEMYCAEFGLDGVVDRMGVPLYPERGEAVFLAVEIVFERPHQQVTLCPQKSTY